MQDQQSENITEATANAPTNVPTEATAKAPTEATAKAPTEASPEATAKAANHTPVYCLAAWVLTLAAWVSLLMSWQMSVGCGIIAIVLGVCGLRGTSAVTRRWAVAAIIAASVLLVVLTAFCLVINII